MATAQLIDLSNYDTMLVQSTQSRSGTPDGNIFFDTTNGKIEFITKQELAQVNLGSGLEDNPLDETLGIKFEAAYAFENQERATDETLRKFDRWTSASFKFAGAFSFINSRKPSTAADRNILRGSGWNEYATDGGLDRIYFGNKGLGAILGTSKPYYQLSDGGAPSDYAKLGQIDEAVQVFGDTGNTPSDAGAGDFDTRTYQSVSIRTFGQNYDRKETTTDLGISELGPYSTGFAVTESAHLTTGTYTLADVYGGAQVSPWTGMRLVKCAGAASGAVQIDVVATAGTFTRSAGDYIADGFTVGQSVTFANFTNGGNNVTKVISALTATIMTVSDTTGLVDETGSGDETATGTTVTVTGFNEADGAFSWIVENAVPGDLDQCVAFLDALAQTDDDIDEGAVTVTNGKRVGTWYTYDAQGRIVTRSGADALGLFINAIPTADEQRVVFTDDAAGTKTRPFLVSLETNVGASAKGDGNAWYHCFFEAAFNSGSAVTVQDSAAADIKGAASEADGSNKIYDAFDYDGDTLGGGAGTDKDAVMLCEGDGGATQAKTLFTFTRQTTISITCAPTAETNV